MLRAAQQDAPDQFYRHRDIESYEKGKGDEPDLLYRLPELLADSAARPDDPIFICEGAREARGESIRLPERLWSVAGIYQTARELVDPFLEILSERLEGLEGKVRASDIWKAIGLGDPGKRNQDHNVRLSAVMQKMGWRRPASKLRFGGKPQFAWVKGPEGLAVGAFEEVPRSVGVGLADEDGRPM